MHHLNHINKKGLNLRPATLTARKPASERADSQQVID